MVVILLNPRPYETYTLDPAYPAAQAGISSDVGGTLINAVIAGISKYGGTEPAKSKNGRAFITQGQCPAHIAISQTEQGQACFNELQAKALDIYQKLATCETPDAIMPLSASNPTDCAALITNYRNGLSQEIGLFIAEESNLSGGISAYSAKDEIATELNMKIKDFDALAQDLNGYDKRLTALSSPLTTFPQVCDNKSILNDEIKTRVGCAHVTRPDYGFQVLEATRDNALYGGSVSRPVSFQVNTLNLVTTAQASSIDPTKKKTIAAIALNFADTHRWFGANTFRWEGSAGIFFSAIPDRSYSVTSLYYQANASTIDSQNCPAASSTNPVGTLCDNIVTEKVLRPSLVPFTALHYRVSPDAKFVPWKTAVYMTGAVGYNVNTSSADFAGGLSLNWRSIMISPLWHWGHDVRLTNGFYSNESLGANFKGTSVTTEDYWRSMFAVGVSVRVPSLSGR